MKGFTLCFCVALFSGRSWCDNAHLQPRYSGGANQNGNSIANGNDGELGQLSGFFNALVNELQNAPSLANGPQESGKKMTDGGVTNNPDSTLSTVPSVAEDEDVATTAAAAGIPARSSFSSNNDNFIPPTHNINMGDNFNPPDFNTFNQEPSFSSGPSMFGGGAGPFGMGPMGPGPMGPGPMGQGPYSGYNNNDNYNYDQTATTKKPLGNPSSYGGDNSKLQEMGMGQLGQFFSAMVGELQNSGFNNSPQGAVAPKKLTKKTSASTVVSATVGSE